MNKQPHNFWQASRTTLFMSGPLIGSQVGGTLCGFISMVMMARLGHNVLAAGALINSVLFSLLVPLWMLFTAVGVLVGHNYGANQFAEIGKIVRQGLALGVLLGIPGIVILWHIAPILIFFGQDQNLAILTQQYYRAYAWGLIPSLCYSCLTQFLLGISKQKMTLLFTYIAVPLVVFFGYILIFGKFGCQAFGISGMGYANAISFIIIDLLIISYLLSHKSFAHYRIFAFSHARNFHYLKEIFNVGWPIALMIASELIIFSLSIILIGWLGEASLAAQQISLQINLIAIMIPMGIAQASTILISQAAGRKQYAMVRHLGYAGMILAFIATLITAIIYLTIPKALIGLYIDIHSRAYAETIKLAISLLAVTGIMNLSDGIRCVAASSLRGLRDTVVPMIVFVILGGVLSLPSGYFLAVPLHLGAVGYRWGFVFGFLIGAVILMYRFHKFSAVEFLTRQQRS